MQSESLDLQSLLSQDFQTFVEKSFTELHGPGRFEPADYISVVCHHINALIGGSEQRLLINMPPRHLKSFIASVSFPAFALANDPSKKIILATYGEKLSLEHAVKIRQLMNTKWYREMAPQTKVAKGSTADVIRTTDSGYLLATSVGGAVTGFGADIIVVDDLVKADASAKERQSANDWFVNSLLTRFDNPKIGAAIIACHRTHIDDLTAFVTANGNWTHLAFAAIATKHEEFSKGYGTPFVRETGDPLHPDRMSIEDLAKQKEELGSTFAAQYQQTPEVGVDTLFEKNWFKPISTPMNLNNYEYRVHSWDAASSVSPTSSYSVCTIYGVADERIDLLHTSRMRVRYPQLVTSAWQLIRQFPPTHVIIENASAGQSLIDDLFEDLGHGIIVHSTTQSKEVRAERVLKTLRRKGVNIVQGAEWTEAFLSEVLSFPNGFHDDQVDSLTQFLLHYQHGFRLLHTLDQERLVHALYKKYGTW